MIVQIVFSGDMFGLTAAQVLSNERKQLGNYEKYLPTYIIISCFFSSIKTEPDEYEYDFESKPTLFKGIGDLYEELPNEAIILNTIGAALVGLAIVMPCILKCDAFKKGLEPEAGDNSDIE